MLSDPSWAVLAFYSLPDPDTAVDREAITATLEGWLEADSQPGRGRPWTEQDVREIANNPGYAYGFMLEPFGDFVAAVDTFTRSLAERPDDYTIEALDAEYRRLLVRLEASGQFRRVDCPEIVPVSLYLEAQLRRIERLRAGEDA
ncbi:MAG: hypothetical protein HY690_15480 [Chloroflexi bacterium]|nr:hypothetical protein [Chloroflexota bacterium]